MEELTQEQRNWLLAERESKAQTHRFMGWKRVAYGFEGPVAIFIAFEDAEIVEVAIGSM